MALYYLGGAIQSPISSPINTIKLENAIFDEVILSVDTDISEFPDEWSKSTKLHAKFQNNIVAGGLEYDTNKNNTESGFIIKRRELSDIIWTSVGYINSSDFILDEDLLNGSFVDRTAFPNEDYEYIITSIFYGQEIGSTPVSPPVHCYTDGISVSELDKTYYTPIEPKISSVTQNKGATIVETFNGKYPYSFKCGCANYSSGTASGMFVPILDNCKFIFSNENNNNIVWKYRNELKECLCNGKPKILKYFDGRTKLVSINDTVSDDEGEYNDKNITTFSWTEIGDITSTNDMIDNGLMNEY